jgi:hypothetical protein
MGVAIGTDIILPPYLTQYYFAAVPYSYEGGRPGNNWQQRRFGRGSVGRAQFPAARAVARKRRSSRYGAPELAASTS